MMSNLQPLKWKKGAALDTFETVHELVHYTIRPDVDDPNKYRANLGNGDHKTLNSVDEAKHWIEIDYYPHKMQPYVKPDSITDIANWFKAAKPEPTKKDICTQVGCHYEEVAEMDDALKASCGENERVARLYKAADSEEIEHHINDIDHIELLDALCDQIVTATGVAYMMGFDIEGALKEVIRSNNSKMVNGKFEFDANGKITKPESYSEPDLTPFISTMKNLHKGEQCE